MTINELVQAVYCISKIAIILVGFVNAKDELVCICIYFKVNCVIASNDDDLIKRLNIIRAEASFAASDIVNNSLDINGGFQRDFLN